MSVSAERLLELDLAARDAAIRAGVKKTASAKAKAYFNDPDAFIRNCFKWPKGKSPASYQLRVATEMVKSRRVAVRGPRGLGKTAVAAWIVLWFVLTREGEDWKVLTTASVWRQLEYYLWPEIHKWARLLDWEKLGREPFTKFELLKLELNLKTGGAKAAASDNPETLEGAHADHVLYLLDEAKIIPTATWDAIEGTFSGNKYPGMMLAVSTPGAPAGRFYDIHSHAPGLENWKAIHVTAEEMIAAGRMQKEDVDQRRRMWGESSSLYQQQVLGNFAADDVDAVCPLSWVELAVEYWYEIFGREGHAIDYSLLFEPLTTVGVDVSDGGNDSSIFAPRFGNVIPELIEKRYPPNNTLKLADDVEAYIRKHGRAIGGKFNVIPMIDDRGVGTGATEKLRKVFPLTFSFVAGARTDMKDESDQYEFTNTRSAAWWNFRALLNPETGQRIAIPPDPKLIGELVAPRFERVAGAKIKVESKADIKKRIGRSTDRADAVIQAFFPRPVNKSKIISAGTSPAKRRVPA